MSIAITTTKGHVARALSFVQRDDLYFKLGKSVTPWDDEKNPVIASPDDSVEEVLGYKKVETALLVVPDPNGSLVYRNERYRPVLVDNAFSSGAKWVYLSSTIASTELPVDGIYRQIGLSSRVKVKSSVDVNQYALLPSDVDDPGIDEVIDNRKPIYRSEDMTENIVVVIEF